MAFDKPPVWAQHAIATKQGWVDPNTNEILISIKLSDEIIAKYGTAIKTANQENSDSIKTQNQETEEEKPKTTKTRRTRKTKRAKSE